MTSLRFLGDFSPAIGAAFAVLAAGASWFLYRRETRSIPAPLSWLLPLLRSLAIALTVLVLTGPILHHRYQQGNPGRILVLVDGSQSMMISDKQSDRDQKIAIARSLGWTRDALESESKNQSSLDPMHDVLERFDRSNRYKRAIELLLSSDQGLLESLHENFEINVARFDGNGPQVLWESTLASQPDLPESVDAWSSENPGRSTAMGTALQAAVGTELASSDLVSAAKSVTAAATRAESVIVLLSDGQHNSGASPLEVAAKFASGRRKVFAIGYGSKAEAIDVGINAIECPERLFHTDTLRGEMVIKDRAVGKELTATIKHRGKTVWERQITTENSAERRIDFSFPLETVVASLSSQTERGVEYTAIPLAFEVELSRLDDEVDFANNSSQLNVTAVTQRIRMLILDGRSRWETRYLRNIFRRDPIWSVDCVIFESDHGASLTASASSGDENAIFPDSREALLDYDLIVLGELPPGSLSIKHQSWIREFVEVSGGGLILIDGARGHLRGSAFSSMHSLLPVRWRQEPLLNQFPHRAGLTATGSQLAALRIAESSEEENKALWLQLPELRFASRVEALPGSEILATATNQVEQTPLFITRQFGAGRVFFSATDETWRWRYRIADAIHQRLWNQIARWVRRLPMAANGECLSLDSGRSSYTVGDSIEIRARLKHPDGRMAANQSVEAVVDSALRTVLTVPLIADSSIPGIYAGRAEELPVGDYRVSVRASGFNREALDVHTQFSVVEPISPEMQQLARNRQLLEQLAETTGGKYLDEEDSHQLRELLRPLSSGTIMRSDIPIWQSYWWFVPIVALLSLEWWLRKKTGLI